MIWLPILLLHATPAYLPTPAVARLALADLDGGDSGSISGSGSSGSSGSASTASSSGSSASSNSASSGDSTGGSTGGASGTTGGELGHTTSDDGESQDFGVPSHCNTSNDCPNLFECAQHKCRPTPQFNVDAGGCSSAPGLGWVAGLLGLGLLLRRRRDALPRK